MFLDYTELSKVLVRAISIALCGFFKHIACDVNSCNQNCDTCPLGEGSCTVCIHVDTPDCPYHVTRKEML